MAPSATGLIISHLYCGQQQAKRNGAKAAIVNLPALFSNESPALLNDLRRRFFFATNVDRLGSRNVSMNLLAHFAMENHLRIALN